MIADLKAYTKYKEPGLPWLGQVPGHWDVRRVRQVGRLLKGVGGKGGRCLKACRYFGYGELHDGQLLHPREQNIHQA
jgi:hypothetical protein